MSNPEADRNPDLITGLIIGSKSLFAYSEGGFFKHLVHTALPLYSFQANENYK